MTASRTILITSPGGPENEGDAARDTPRLERRGSACGGRGGCRAHGIGQGEEQRAPCGRPLGRAELADLGGDAARRALEGLRGGHRAAALRRADPRLAEVATRPSSSAGCSASGRRPCSRPELRQHRVGRLRLDVRRGAAVRSSELRLGRGVAMKFVTRSLAAESTPCVAANFVTMKPWTPRNGTDGLHDRGDLDHLERQAALLQRVGVPRAGDPEGGLALRGRRSVLRRRPPWS